MGDICRTSLEAWDTVLPCFFVPGRCNPAYVLTHVGDCPDRPHVLAIGLTESSHGNVTVLAVRLQQTDTFGG